MKFNRPKHIDDMLFVVALLVPALFAGARYFESEREVAQIAQAQTLSAPVADTSHAPAPLRIARAEGRGW